jgi:hypothetical protein
VSVPGGSAFHVTSTGVISSGPGGILHTVTIGTGDGSAALTLHDGADADAPVITVITTAAAPASLAFDAVIVNGLYGEVSGSLDATVVILPNEDFPA